MTGVCGMKKERACWRRAWGTHKFSSVDLRDLAYLLGWGESVGTCVKAGGGTVDSVLATQHEQRDWAVDDGRAFVLLAKGIPTGVTYTYSNAQYAPEGMEPRSGEHDGKGARWGTLIKASVAAEVGTCWGWRDGTICQASSWPSWIEALCHPIRRAIRQNGL
jgi:hypothetical protein